MTTVLPMTEDDLKATVIEIAELHGWLKNHQRPARTAKGWRTAIEGDKGFPDWVFARGVRPGKPPRLLFSEFKTERGRLSPDQRRWLEVLVQMPFVETAIWTPDDLRSGRIEDALT